MPVWLLLTAHPLTKSLGAVGLLALFDLLPFLASFQLFWLFELPELRLYELFVLFELFEFKFRFLGQLQAQAANRIATRARVDRLLLFFITAPSPSRWGHGMEWTAREREVLFSAALGKA